MESKSLGYKIFKPIVTFIFKIVYHPKVVNKDYIPQDGSLIICGNHRHLFDCLMVAMCTKRPIHFLAKKELFKNIFTRTIFNIVGCIPVDRSNKNPEAKKEALKYLNNNGVIGVFPEGGRNRTENDLNEFKYGAVSMASKSGATIVPFAIVGDYKLFNKNLTITFSKPYKIKENANLEEENKKLRSIVQKIISKSGYKWKKKK